MTGKLRERMAWAGAIWLSGIGITTLLGFALLILIYLQGMDLSIPYLFLVPILMASFRYLWRGVIYSAVIASAYVVIATVLLGGSPWLALLQAIIFVWVGVFVAYLTVNLKLEQGRYRAIFDSAESGICIFSPHQGRISDVNLRCASWLGYTRADLIGREFTSLWKQPQALNSLSCTLREKGSAGDVEAELVAKDGTTRWGLVSLVPVPDGSLLLTLVDITARKEADATLQQYQEHLEEQVEERTRALEQANLQLLTEVADRKRAEQALRIREAHLTAIFEAALRVAYIITSIEGTRTTILDFSPGAEHTFGYRKDEVVGKPVALIHLPEDIERLAAYQEKMQKKGVEYSGELTMVRKSGERFPVLFSMYPLPSSDGILTRAVCVAIDITKRKQAEEKIRASLEEKEQLLQEIHHRVKNNMQVISGFLALQARKIRDPAVQQMFTDSENRIRTMALIHENLYQSRSFGRIRMQEYLGRLADFLLHSYAELAARVKTTVDAGEVTMDIDTAIPCGLVVNELVSNALKYAFPEGKEGTIRISLAPEPGGGYGMVIADDGIGLPPNVDFSTTDTLGLSLVHGLVTTQLGGTIGIERGQGTMYRITIPARQNPKEP
ncbi:MAG: PAS domain S-box protein [Methanomicrobiales archaeon]|nr:PAS domain S-box protein [Methanomicrobiales archaeon]